MIALSTFATGCAFTNVDVHPPESPSPPQPGVVVAGPGRGREVIVDAPFVDERYERARCGMQKNGWDMDTANVSCTVPPGRWFADELAIELARAGYKPLRSDAVPGPTTVVVRGAVQQLFLEPVKHFWTVNVEGDFGASLVVTTPNGLHAERGFFVKGEEASWASTEGTFQSAADVASHRLAREMVVALTDLLDRYPELGAPSATAAPWRTALVTPRSP